jgi:hypothetical protein
MEDLQNLATDAAVGLKAIQQIQELYDRDMWDIEDPKFEKLRHVHIHLSITVGKLAKLIEPQDHKYHSGETVEMAENGSELRPILADLVMHSAQLANMVNGSLADMYIERCKKNADRFAPESAFVRLSSDGHTS